MTWTMEHKDGGAINLRPDPFPGDRPLIPAIRGADILALNHHLGMTDHSKRELVYPRRVSATSRWYPTPEQLQTLEELYRLGTRSPSAQQIQQITAQLRRYGFVEGKNVFYWFQNHKARERLKRRRQLHEQQHHYRRLMQQSKNTISAEKARDADELEHVKSWPPSTNSTTVAETSQGGAQAEEGESMVHEGLLEDAQLLQQQQMMYLSCSTNHIAPSSSSSASSVAVLPPQPLDVITVFSRKKPETLELFPLNSGIRAGVEAEGDSDRLNRRLHRSGPHPFFEFLH